MHPLLILLVGMATVIGAIVLLRMNAFLALIVAAVLVSLLSPGEAGIKIVRVAEAFGRTAGNVGIVIALAAVIGKAMMDSGAADRIVRAFVALLGVRRGGTAFMASGFVLSIPVFFDTVFYLLVPLARSMFTRTQRQYLKYIMAIAAGGAAAHTLIPPTPGPLVVAGTLGVDIGTMLLVGIAVALPASVVGLLFSGWMDRRMSITLRTEAGGIPEMEAAPPVAPPSLMLSVLPIVLPVLLISVNTVVASMAAGAEGADSLAARLAPFTAVVGNSNFALLLAAAIAVLTYQRQRRPSRAETSSMVEASLMSAGIIILITAAGGAFGAMLQAAEVGPAIRAMFAESPQAGPGFGVLLLAFGVSSLLKIAQGSSTVAMITTAGMLSAMITGVGPLPFHPVYVATAISSGALVGSWMNDSGFWIFTKMGGLTEAEALKTWTPLLALVGVVAMTMTVLLALLVPMV